MYLVVYSLFTEAKTIFYSYYSYTSRNIKIIITNYKKFKLIYGYLQTLLDRCDGLAKGIDDMLARLAANIPL